MRVREVSEVMPLKIPNGADYFAYPSPLTLKDICMALLSAFIYQQHLNNEWRLVN